jgi:hypothetical protein
MEQQLQWHLTSMLRVVCPPPAVLDRQAMDTMPEQSWRYPSVVEDTSEERKG